MNIKKLNFTKVPGEFHRAAIGKNIGENCNYCNSNHTFRFNEGLNYNSLYNV